jgi:tRNA-specific 2-thiouridylase
MGINYLATGHYARIIKGEVGYRLLKGIDTAKDQSYFLYTSGQAELSRILFPVGGYTKKEIRKIAIEKSLPAADREESQDICFLAGDYRDFIRRYVNLQPGDIVDISGRVIGRHEGLALYTIGQRHGLGISANEPIYVLELDAGRNRVVAGSGDRLYTSRLIAEDLRWVAGTSPSLPAEVTAKIRYRAPAASARVTVRNDIAEVEFIEPQRSVTPGQSVVFYRGDEVLGGGIIRESCNTDAVHD